jgi:hypothetical protein
MSDNETDLSHPMYVSESRSNDDGVRDLFVRLIGFVASARAPHADKNDALDAIEKLQSRLLP